MKNYKIWALIGILTIFSVLCGCLNLSDKPQFSEDNEELSTVKVMLMPFMSFAPFFIAEEEGYFLEQGIKIEFIKFGSPVQAMPSLAQGDLDVATGGITSSLFNSISRGVNVKVVADKGRLHDRCSNAAILINKELAESGEISEISHLNGKKLALEDFGGWGYIYSKVLEKGNLSLEDIDNTFMPPPDRVIALQIAYIIYGPSILGKNPDLGKRFMVAYLKGVKQFKEGKTERNIDIIQKYTQLDKELIENSCWIAINSRGYMNTQSLLDVQEWGYNNGYVDELVTEDQLFDLSFVEYANKVLG
jgi:NitT/TauT family transport system substrate-binding protein